MTLSKKLQIGSYYHFRKIVLFTWVAVFILFNVQQRHIDLKVSSDVQSNPGPTVVVEKAVLGSFH